MRLDSFKTKAEAIAYLKRKKGCATSKEAEKYLRNFLPKESFYQERIIKYIKAEYPKAFVWKAAAGAYTRAGIPDVCMVLNGKFYGLEVKRPYIGKTSFMQEIVLRQIKAAGGIAGVVVFPQDVERMISNAKRGIKKGNGEQFKKQ